MISVEIPGYGSVKIENLVMDYNGTMAVDGYLVNGLKPLIEDLAKGISIYVITADTFGRVAEELADLPVKVAKLKGPDEGAEKLQLINKLGRDVTAAIGNGNNDGLMLKGSAVGICIMGKEGCSKRAMDGADIVMGDITSALELLKNPNRLKATLRF